MFADRDEERLADECGVIEDDKGQVRYFAGDLREKLTVANLLSATLDSFDRIDILVNASRQILTTDPLDPTTVRFRPCSTRTCSRRSGSARRWRTA
jgi:7-alpha-hydroxysteroid dehydrogenase